MKKQKIALPTKDDSGLSAKISDHFGHCRLFTIVEITDDTITATTTFTNPDGEKHGCSHLLTHLQKQGVDTVVPFGMGGNMLDRCNKGGIRVLLAEKERHGDVGSAMEDMLAGKLSPMQQHNICTGSGHCTGHSQIG